MAQEIEVVSDIFKTQSLYEFMTTEVCPDISKIQFRVQQRPIEYRADPTILIAVVGGVSAALTALIAGGLRILERRSEKGKIVIEGESGRRVEVPAATSPERIEELIRLSHDLDVKRIHILSK